MKPANPVPRGSRNAYACPLCGQFFIHNPEDPVPPHMDPVEEDKWCVTEEMWRAQAEEDP